MWGGIKNSGGISSEKYSENIQEGLVSQRILHPLEFPNDENKKRAQNYLHFNYVKVPEIIY